MYTVKNYLKAFFIIAGGLLLATSILLSPFGIMLCVASLLAIPLPFLRYYIQQVWESVDQTINAIGLGNMDHTISGRVGRLAVQGDPVGRILERVINTILWFDKNHCRKAIEHDEKAKRYFSSNSG